MLALHSCCLGFEWSACTRLRASQWMYSYKGIHYYRNKIVVESPATGQDDQRRCPLSACRRGGSGSGGGGEASMMQAASIRS